MSDIFNAMYDEIFLKENKVDLLDEEKINSITQKYIESRANIGDKKDFLRLKREYFKIISIKDYEKIQKILYAGKNRKEIVSFELLRILSKNDGDIDILGQVSNVEKIIDLYEEDIPEDLYMKIVNGLIELEISLGLKIGLFKEFCILFQEECKKIEEGLTDKVKYSRQK